MEVVVLIDIGFGIHGMTSWYPYTSFHGIVCMTPCTTYMIV